MIGLEKIGLVALTLVFIGCGSSSEKGENTANVETKEVVEEIELPGSEQTAVVIKEPSELELTLIDAGLVDVQKLDSNILLDLRYSDTLNFLEADVYEDYDKCFLQADVAEKLLLASSYLKSLHPNYSLLVFDAVRPRSVQWKMWEVLDMPTSKKTKYVSNPKNGSLHNYGAAVDLTIVNEFNEELDMGTPYDYFGELAYPRLEKKMLKEGRLTQQQLDNRLLLRKIMETAEFSPITTEWWHFNSCSRVEASMKYKIVE